VSDFPERCTVRFSRYWNIPRLRDFSLMDAYRKMIRKEVAECRPNVMLLYNMEPYHASAAEVLIAEGVRWIPIILDEDEVGARGWDRFSQRVKDAAGLVFLSHWGFVNCPVAIPKLHLDGGVRTETIQALSDLGKSGPKTVLYSGVYVEGYGGLKRLFEIFSAITDQSCRFLLTGKDAKGNLKRYLPLEPRATYLGFVSRDELKRIHSEATVFVNTRSSEASENRMTFPSKLLEYLSYGKPIVSTWTEGLAPEYRELLLVPEQNTVQCFARLIEEALNYSHDEQLALQQRILTWASSHTWKAQATRLVEFIERLEHG
jgi:glycosyltransferase involved in cell wall biosynthesis